MGVNTYLFFPGERLAAELEQYALVFEFGHVLSLFLTVVVGKTPVAFIDPDVFEERVKRPVDRVDEPGLAVKEAFLSR